MHKAIEECFFGIMFVMPRLNLLFISKINKLQFYFQLTYCKWENGCYIIAKDVRLQTTFEQNRRSIGNEKTVHAF